MDDGSAPIAGSLHYSGCKTEMLPQHVEKKWNLHPARPAPHAACAMEYPQGYGAYLSGLPLSTNPAFSLVRRLAAAGGPASCALPAAALPTLRQQHAAALSSRPIMSLLHRHGVTGSCSSLVCCSPAEKKSLGEVFSNAGKKALSGGIPGMAAMAIQVLSLMWLRTTVNYQYRYGTSTMTAFRTLYKEGGIPRFYRGLLPALVQGPLSRFGDTAANTGMLALLDSYEGSSGLPVGVKTLSASLAAGLFRICLMPVDALKTIMQVEGKNGLTVLGNKMRVSGPSVLYHGALAASAATFVGHYPWFATYNYLNEYLPRYDNDLPRKLLRSALIGFCASFVSDCASNSIRVVKTYKQTATEATTYVEVVRNVIAKEGVLGLMGRGLGTKILANGMQGIMFSVLWRLGQDYYNKQQPAAK